MRYWKGSIALSPTQDLPLLQQVLRSNFVTHRQLYDLLRLDYHATSRNAFNNRVLRLVKHQYLVRDEISLRRDGYVYSISDIGASELIGLGEYYTGPTPPQGWTASQRRVPCARTQPNPPGAQALATVGPMDV